MGDKLGKRDIYLFLRYLTLLFKLYRETSKMYPNEDDCKFLIKYYDEDGDGYLSFME